MQTQVEKVNNIREGILSREQIDTLAKASIIPYDTPAPVLQVFAATCAAHGLSPYKREIYLVKYGTQYNTIVGIDGLRAKAARTGQLAGKDDAQFNRRADGSYLTAADVLASGKPFPDTCTVTVYRMVSGHRAAFTKTVLWREYAPAKLSGKWIGMGFNMLEKCAEAAALRMAFADETAGLHVEEEREAFQDTTVQAATQRPEVLIDVDDLKEKIAQCNSAADLMNLYKQDYRHAQFADLFSERKNQLAA
jgi:phage recombination protein Bet